MSIVDAVHQPSQAAHHWRLCLLFSFALTLLCVTQCTAGLMLCCCYSADDTDALAGSISANASLLLPAYEAALRILATANDGAAAAADAAQYAAPVVAARVAFHKMILNGAFTFAGCITEQQQQQQQVLRQLYALQVTCLKCAVQDATQPADGHSEAGDSEVLWWRW
jgi:hypothetical protein